MPYFLRHKDEMINLDLVAKISKDQYKKFPFIKYTYAIVFHGDYKNRLEFKTKKSRDKIFYCVLEHLTSWKMFFSI